MSKLFGLIGFAIALIWTWDIVYSTNAGSISTEVHFNIQNRLNEIILEQIAKKRPQATNIKIQRLWTEKINETKLRARFAYRYNEKLEGKETVDQRTEGEAILFREPSEDRNTQKWILQSLKTTTDQINFAEGVVISPDMQLEELQKEAPANDAAAAAAAAPKEAKAPTAPALKNESTTEKK